MGVLGVFPNDGAEPIHEALSEGMLNCAFLTGFRHSSTVSVGGRKPDLKARDSD